MYKIFLLSMIVALPALGGCGTRRDDAAAEKGAASHGEGRRSAKQRAEEEARAKKAIEELQGADEAALVAALNHEDRRVRRAALQMITEQDLRSETAIEGIIPRLADHWAPVSRAAKQALVGIGEPAVAPLIAAFGSNSPHRNLSFSKGGKDGGTSIRTVIKDTLGEIGEPAVPALIEALENSDPLIRRNAIGALGRIGPRAAAAIPALVHALEKDNDATVRLNALGDLGLIAPLEPKLEPAARAALNADDPRLRKTANKTIENIERARRESGGADSGVPAAKTGE